MRMRQEKDGLVVDPGSCDDIDEAIPKIIHAEKPDFEFRLEPRKF